MNKKLIMLLLAGAIAAIFVTTGLQAGTQVDDTFPITTPGYEDTKRKKGPPRFKPVTFTHKKHTEDYGISCGECHHDETGEPLELKMGDEVHPCYECHNIFEKDKDNRRDIMVHENAMHENCRECHKEVNIEAGDPKGRKGPAPTSCNQCHEKA
ncbi:MAG: cytochrome c family protein [Desulfotignum sp.]|nr:cytochrome c family protein [Desulfotignum sp.]MCF8112862.1 cytochrome c family protein [Desulfotignum sp.]MCF8125186.1 cytochrome c family protein [Desulfotignum sp.]